MENRDEKKTEPQKTEEYCVVLDYLPTGKSSAVRTEAIAQVIGKDFFTLLEVTPKPGVNLSVGETVYVGKDDRPKINLIKNRIKFGELTSNSVAEIEDTIVDIIEENKEKYLEFYNKARPISLKRHQLELLPSLGKKHMNDILNEREKKPFESFDEIVKRVKNMPEPKKAIVKRIMEELEGAEDKHYIFVRPPAAPKKPYFNKNNSQGNRNNFRRRY
jgi:putative nucleotide binding protein